MKLAVKNLVLHRTAIMSVFRTLSDKSVVYNLTISSKTSARNLTVTLNQYICFNGRCGS